MNVSNALARGREERLREISIKLRTLLSNKIEEEPKRYKRNNIDLGLFILQKMRLSSFTLEEDDIILNDNNSYFMIID